MNGPLTDCSNTDGMYIHSLQLYTYYTYDGTDWQTVNHRGFGLTTLGVLSTCSCTSTKIDAVNFANPYLGALLDTSTVTVTVKGAAKTATLLLDELIDSVSLMCSEYNVSCGEIAAFITNLKTGEEVDLTGEH
jgi:hypothetical protein